VISKRILHYRVEEQLHKSTMSIVYRAFDTRRRKPVALKVLQELDDAAKVRLRLETHIAKLLVHPNIVQTYGLEEVDDMVFLVMEYYEGDSVAQRIARDGWLEVDDALDITLQAAYGLAYIHQNRIVHRDIKPTNVFVTREGVAKILDFGVSRKEGLKGLTLTSGFTGTLAYMPPEQIRGETVNAQADLWSLGATLYEMLTGRTPFASRDLGVTLSKIQNYQPTPVRQVRPDVPLGLQDIINNLLAKRLEERYKSADMLAIDLTRLQEEPQRRFLYATPKAATALVSEDLPYPEALEQATRSQERYAATSNYLPNNLPEPYDTLAGRQSELTVMRQHFALEHNRLITLLGPKGIGKSRLALEYALEQRQRSHFTGGVYWIHALGNTQVIATSIGHALHLTPTETDDPGAVETAYVTSLADFLAAQPALLVLNDLIQNNIAKDSDAIAMRAQFVEMLLNTCPSLQVIVTAERRLRLAAEWVLPL
jgi:serine/threonine protein kinase